MSQSVEHGGPMTRGRSVPIARRLAASMICASVLVLGGCSALNPPANSNKALYDPEKSAVRSRLGGLSYSSKTCAAPGNASFIMPPSGGRTSKAALQHLTMRYSPGDRFNVFVFGAPEFAGDYAINADGTVVLPFTGQVDALGLTNSELSKRIETKLVQGGIFTREAIRLSLRPVQYAPINVTVAGAVFIPGRHSINTIRDADKQDRALNKFGDSPMERFVGAGLRAAGGVRPDADLSNIKVTRNGRTFTLDWRGAITGAAVDDMPLIEGDHVEVGESGCFQSALVRPSQITVGGIRIFNSNLTTPTQSAAPVNFQQANSVPYGTRFLQGLVQANCVGGTLGTNASRYAVLISRNPKTRETEVVQRSIEDLVRSPDRDALNPYLMPDDAIACYDSTVTEVRDVLSIFQSILVPTTQLKSLGVNVVK